MHAFKIKHVRSYLNLNVLTLSAISVAVSVLTEYSRVTLKYCIMLYKAINLNTQKEVIKAARPSL